MASHTSLKGKFGREFLRQRLARELPILSRKRRGRGVPDFIGAPPGDGLPFDPYDLPKDITRPASGAPQKQAPIGDVVLPRQRICIVGAGVGGLYTAMILDSLAIQNLEYDILESADRVGGRLYTYHFDPSPHLYYDIGAMRYPRIPIMDRTFDLFTRVGVDDKLIQYYMDSSDGAKNVPAYFNNYLHIDKELPAGSPDDENWDVFHISTDNGGPVPAPFVKKGVSNILEEIFGPYKLALEKDWKTGFAKLMTKDSFSTREYIRTTEYGTFETVQWLETMNSASGLYDQAFSESVIDSFDFDFPETKSGVERWACLEGGSSVLIDAMTSKIKVKPTLNHRVTAISIDRTSDIANPVDPMIVQFKNGTETVTQHYSTVFNTASLACTQRMDLSGAELHPTQKDALRCLRYDASSKVAIVFETAWWIIGGISKGGASSTDYPIRTCVYPSYNIGDDPTKPSVLLCSYQWAQDAQRIGGLIDSKTGQGKNEELKEVMLNDLAVLHSNIITREKLEEQFLEMNAFDWYANPNTSGAFALFGPGQFSHLYPLLCRPTADGNLHFVGEATSTHHAWVVGALNSSWRAVYYFLKKNQMKDGPLRWYWQEKIDLLIKLWGTIDEVDTAPDGTAHLQVMLGQLKPEDHVQLK